MIAGSKTMFALLGLVFLMSQLIGCGSSQKTIRKSLGVKNKRITVTQLGSGYKKYKGTKFDVFSTNKKTRKLTKRKKPLKVNYLHFGIKSYDKANHSANVLYAKYKFAETMQKRVLRDVNDLLNIKNIFKVKGSELNRALRKGKASEISQIRKIQDSVKNLEASMRAIPDFISQASTLIGETKAISTNVVQDLGKQPARALLIPDITKQTLTTTNRLQKVITGTPRLISNYKKLISVLVKLY